MIVFDQVTTNAGITNGSSQVSYSVTVGAYQNSILICGFSNFNATLNNRTISTVTYNGVALTKIRADEISGASGQRTELWYLLKPTVGTFTLLITAAAGTGASIDSAALSLGGVNQANPIDAQNTATTASAASVTCSVTTVAAGAYIVDVCECATGPQSAGANQTRKWDQSGSTSSGSIRGPLYPAGPFSTSYSVGGTDKFIMSSVSLNPASLSLNNYQFVSAGDGISVSEKIR